jgi:hypothetical protein
MTSRGPLAWIVAILAGIALVIVVTAMIGNRDKSGETVSAGEWAQSVCGSIGVWRGEMKAIVDDVRQAPARGTMGVEEPQSQTKQGSAGLVRVGLERAVRATDVLVTGIDNAGVPDTGQGEAAAQQVASWATNSTSELEHAQDTLDKEAPTLEDAVVQLTGAAGSLRLVLASGVETLADVALLDPELTSAVRESSTCQQLREDESST